MASSILCLCGDRLGINLYEGHGLELLIPEELTDLPHAPHSASAVEPVRQLVLQSRIAVTCDNCGVLSIVDNALRIKRYAPIAASD
jgi:hypothetical protein